MKNADDGIAEPALKYDSVIAGLEFSEENHIQMRGHVLVWHAQTPRWFFREGYRGNGDLVDRNTMLQSEYPGVIYCWDVVNEAVEVVEGHYAEAGIPQHYIGVKASVKTHPQGGFFSGIHLIITNYL